MPYVSISSAMPVSDEKKDVIQKEIGKLITMIPGKTIDNCMTKIEGGSSMFMSGKPSKTVFCEVRLRGAAPKESKKQFLGELYQLFINELGAEKVYTNFLEFDEWGNDDNYLEA